MTFLGRIVVVCAATLMIIGNLCAANRNTNFYRDFWMPTYQGIRLNYCTVDGCCGFDVANRYCQMMGYARADRQLIENNVGFTKYISTFLLCRGWRCNGFKNIRCVGNFTHVPPKAYHYRFRKFVYPRYEHFRVDWCYDGRQQCGRRAAYSFCRRLGYLNTHRFAIETNVAATKAIGNHKLCFGQQCNAFEYITCFR